MRELIIGGMAQGKREYCQQKHPEAMVLENMEKAFDEDGMYLGQEVPEQTVIWNRYHETVKEWMSLGLEPEEIWTRTSAWMKAHHEWVIISDEIGNGIVPMESGQRHWREETGRLLCKIAREADCVERICCGLPIRIK